MKVLAYTDEEVEQVIAALHARADRLLNRANELRSDGRPAAEAEECLNNREITMRAINEIRSPSHTRPLAFTK